MKQLNKGMVIPSSFLTGQYHSMKVKDLIIVVLAYQHPLTAKQMYYTIKKKFNSPVTYQAVFKMLKTLCHEGVVVAEDKRYALDKQWIKNVKTFMTGLETTYERTPERAPQTYKLVSFDMNGVLTEENTIIEIARDSPYYKKIKEIITNQTLGKTPFTKAFKEVSRLLKGISLDEIYQYAQQVPLMEGTSEVLALLKNKKTTCIIITTGFSIVAQILNKRLGMPFSAICTNELEFSDGRRVLTPSLLQKIIEKEDRNAMKRIKTTGRIRFRVSCEDDKITRLKEYLRRFKVSPSQVAAVGDTMGDASILYFCSKQGMGIAFNPNLSLLEYAYHLLEKGQNIHIVQSKNLADVKPLLVPPLPGR